MSHNTLNTLPEALSDLTNLKVLLFPAPNVIPFAPFGLLQYLDVSHNCFSVFPTAVLHLPSLLCLDVSYNRCCCRSATAHKKTCTRLQCCPLCWRPVSLTCLFFQPRRIAELASPNGATDGPEHRMQPSLPIQISDRNQQLHNSGGTQTFSYFATVLTLPQRLELSEDGCEMSDLTDMTRLSSRGEIAMYLDRLEQTAAAMQEADKNVLAWFFLLALRIFDQKNRCLKLLRSTRRKKMSFGDLPFAIFAYGWGL